MGIPISQKSQQAILCILEWKYYIYTHKIAIKSLQSRYIGEVKGMMEIDSVGHKVRRVTGESQPVPQDAEACLSPMKARLVQRTRERYEKGLKRLSEI